MIFRHLLGWLSGRPDAAGRKPFITLNEANLDLDEFARLLNSRRPADLKRIARAMSKPKDVPTQT